MHADLPQALLDLQSWDQLTLGECEELPRLVAISLPRMFRFVGMTIHGVGFQRRLMSLFEKKGTTWEPPCSFVLIPGSTVTLGYDRTQRLVPPEELVREWQEYHLDSRGNAVTLDGAGVKDSLSANYDAFSTYLDSKLLPLRTVTLQPFLLEVAALEAREVVPSPLMISARYKWRWEGYGRYVLHHQHASIPQRHVAAFVKHQGFRLPTSDEWEYACSAGVRTFFYWGNGCFGRGTKEAAVNGRRHPFGLEIADDTYRWEYCDTPSIMRGGDGGVTLCGWAGELAASLPLASAYYHQLDEKEICQGVYSPCFRRVYDLGQAVRALTATESP